MDGLVFFRNWRETDYDNFKSEVARHQGGAASSYEHALHDVWAAMYRLQENA